MLAHPLSQVRHFFVRDLPSAHKIYSQSYGGALCAVQTVCSRRKSRSDLSLPLTGEGDHEVVERAVRLPPGSVAAFR